MKSQFKVSDPNQLWFQRAEAVAIQVILALFGNFWLVQGNSLITGKAVMSLLKVSDPNQL